MPTTPPNRPVRSIRRALRWVLLWSAVVAVGATCGALTGPGVVRAATVTAAYVPGHRDVIVNGYGTDGLGAFRFETGTGTPVRAWCLEADVAHAGGVDAYAEQTPTIRSAELDTLVWILQRSPDLDADTATAGAALVWYYAGARRDIGPPVWSDGSNGFSPISPDGWDALPPLSLGHPVGLRAGGVDLDAAERRVAELHRRARAWRGPWAFVTAPAGGVTLRGPAGPIVGATVRVDVTPTGGTTSSSTVRTGSDGGVPLSAPSEGASISIRADSPGAHREWDGSGSTQRMATATNRVIRTSVQVAPVLRHVEVHKQSGDPTISASGAMFELRDADGLLVDEGRTGTDGRLRFDPVDPVRHRLPYRLVETRAPTGLAVVGPVSITEASTDPARPTVVVVVDPPRLVDVVVRKRLTIDAVGPTDRSGFGFRLTRTTDGLVRTVTTRADGSTDPVGLALGTYAICEHAVPPWASGLVDPGCRSLTVGPADLERRSTIVVDYVNEVPSPRIDTVARDDADGDRSLPSTGGTVVDAVSLTGLVPGTTYLLDGSLLRLDGTPTGITASATFEATHRREELDLTFIVPPLEAGRYVIVEHLSVVGAEPVHVAEHVDLADPDQTITVEPPPATTTTTAPAASTTTTTITVTSVVAPRPTNADTTTTVPTTTTTTVGRSPVAVPTSTSTLPVTGSGSVGAALRAADAVIALGFVVTVAAGFLPRRRLRS